MADEKLISSVTPGSHHFAYLCQRVIDTLHLRRSTRGATYADAMSPEKPDGNDYFAQRIAESNSHRSPGGRLTYASISQQPEWVKAFLEREEFS